MGPVRIRHHSYHFVTQPSQYVDGAVWQAKMASIEFLIPWRNAHDPHSGFMMEHSEPILTYESGYHSMGESQNRKKIQSSIDGIAIGGIVPFDHQQGAYKHH